jgi:hypothetical protein
MPPVGFEPSISTGEGPRTYALDRAAAGNGLLMVLSEYLEKRFISHIFL